MDKLILLVGTLDLNIMFASMDLLLVYIIDIDKLSIHLCFIHLDTSLLFIYYLNNSSMLRLLLIWKTVDCYVHNLYSTLFKLICMHISLLVKGALKIGLWLGVRYSFNKKYKKI